MTIYEKKVRAPCGVRVSPNHSKRYMRPHYVRYLQPCLPRVLPAAEDGQPSGWVDSAVVAFLRPHL